MATLKQIQFKRSKTAGARPAASVLAEGELAINLKDRVLFTKDDQGNIIDLGFAKGGSIDGNVIHIGNYNQTGDYTLNGTFTQTGNFNLTGIARVTRDIIAAGQIMTEGGELITKSSGTSHVRFHDSADRERGIIYAPANDGLTTQVVNIRVKDYAAGDESTYAFSGSGLFTSPEVSAWKSMSTPQILTNRVITNNKSTSDYDIYSMADNVPLSESTTAINHLRVMRNAVGAGVFHEVKDNDGITWYTGDGLDTYLWSFTWSGGLKAGHSISVGTPGGNKGYSELGTASISLGDNDTGLKWYQDGYFYVVNNGTRTFLYSPESTVSLRKMVMGYSVNGNDLTTPPTENYALATVVTYHDNNAYGDGQTLLGYYQGGNYHHYFRGKGTTNINTHGGLLVTPGNIDVIGGSVNIDGRNNSSTLMFRGNTTGSSSVDNMTISVWGNTFTNPSVGNRKNVMEISDATSWMSYIQRLTTGEVEMNVNGSFESSGVTAGNRGVHTTGEISSGAVNALRIWNADYGAIFRRSEGSLHIIPTAYGEGKHGDIGPLRPFSMALDTGKVTIPDLQSSYNTFAANGYIKFTGHGAGAGGYDIQYVQAAPVFQEIDDDAVSKYYPIVKQKFLNGKAVWSLGTEISSGTFVIHHLKEDGSQGHTSRFNQDGTVNFPDNVLVGGGEAAIARNGNQENASDPQAIFEFHHNGNMYVPDMVKAGVRISAGGGDPAWTGACVVIGDNDTGLVHGGDGRINMVANGVHIASWSAAYQLHEGLWDTTGALWTEQGRAIISFGHLIQQSDAYSTFVRDVYVRSDIRVKKDLVKFENASEKLSKINGYTYMQKRGLDEEGNQKWEPNAGLIAQEVQAILPELVEGDPDGEALLRLNYNGVIGLNTAAINEHTAEIAELKSEIEELKALIKSLLK
ncbi:putative long tail fiber distal subunit [Escherichia phage HY01]|uniref:Long tail fiber protein Gp37 n=1 Tax=Escherichia phage HY01 TaxID=1434323 RepID=A0A0A0PUA1_9CAUD|nr:long tail fiber protein distal subunit [Escherichia phage HY01]AHK11095.1 putative long tail fiber distal subunit [Escherichia phage HY01]